MEQGRTDFKKFLQPIQVIQSKNTFFQVYKNFPLCHIIYLELKWIKLFWNGVSEKSVFKSFLCLLKGTVKGKWKGV